MLNIASNQSVLTTQITTRPRATQQGRINCRPHIPVPAVPTQEEGRKQSYSTKNPSETGLNRSSKVLYCRMPFFHQQLISSANLLELETERL